eukprot:CAMPEP_0119421078 /NCGR_PEP_ID=MMETSP1335-20130426/25018_1 /TAXON_ID=259385 /ORGANISM="Chrysoculter rhomboideus, Strain RCC1486" /LENGTH=59 /DNA_ID=CAMNT_0007446467 /DNA_START=167 /DNA_END=346 /DNA_ORIENTATION=+
MTNGPCHTTGSRIGFPASNRKLQPCSLAVKVTTSPVAESNAAWPIWTDFFAGVKAPCPS